MNQRLKEFIGFCGKNNLKHSCEYKDNLYTLRIVFPSSKELIASSTDIDQALDIIKQKLIKSDK